MKKTRLSKKSKKHKKRIDLPNVKVNFDILLFDSNYKGDLYKNINKSIKNVGDLPTSFCKYIESSSMSINWSEHLFYTFFIFASDDKKICPLCSGQLKSDWKIKKITVNKHTKIISYDLKPPKGSNYNDIKKSILSEMDRDLSLSMCEGYGCPGSNIRKVYVIINNKKYWWIPYFKSVDIRLSKKTVKKKQLRLNRNKHRSKKVKN